MALLAVSVLLLAAATAVSGQQVDASGGFIGTWEAKWRDKVICTIVLKPGSPVSGETRACSIRVDENGDLQQPESDPPSGEPAPILNPKLDGETLTFEEKDDGELTKFELTLVGDGKARLRILDAPVRINPIPFTRK